MYWETKIFVWLTLFRYLLYCSGLEPNLQCLQSVPVVTIIALILYMRKINWPIES